MTTTPEPTAGSDGFSFIALGVGDAFSALHYSSALLCECDGFRLLVDCPHPIRKILREATGGSTDIQHIDAIALTHLHPDHASGAELFGYYLQYVLKARRPLLLHTAVHELARQPPLQLERYFDLAAGDDDQPLVAGPFTLRFRRNRHLVPTGALRIAAGGRTLGHSSDTPFDPELIEWLASADLILHECGTSSVHTPYAQLAALPPALRARLRLFHLEDSFDRASSAIPALEPARRYRV